MARSTRQAPNGRARFLEHLFLWKGRIFGILMKRRGGNLRVLAGQVYHGKHRSNLRPQERSLDLLQQSLQPLYQGHTLRHLGFHLSDL